MRADMVAEYSSDLRFSSSSARSSVELGEEEDEEVEVDEGGA
jgi:hypothetical protein